MRTTDLDPDLERTVAAALARSMAYRVLSRALAYPDQEVLRRLVDEDLPLALGVGEALPGSVQEGLEALGRSFAGTSVDELEREHRRIFTHVHSADCPAYETDHTARDVWRQAQELADLAGFYRAFGMRHPAERPDHVAVELEFLHLVSYKAAWAGARDDREGLALCAQAEDRFLADHVLRWMPSFAARLEAMGAGGPYTPVGTALAALLGAEAAVRGPAAPEPVPGPPLPEDPSLDDVGLCEEEG